MKKISMKRISCILALVLIGALNVGQVFAQSEDVAIYSLAYDSATTLVDQLRYVRNVYEGDYSDADTADFYLKALNRLVNQYPNLVNANVRTELDAADSAAMIVANRVGEARIESASANLLTMANSFINSLVKAEALMALGKIGDPLYLPHVIRILEVINTQPQSDREMRERSENTASGAILGLEYFGSPEGYLPVFLAYTGWYSQKVRNLAFTSMNQLLADPVEPMLQVVNSSSYNYDTKYTALKTMEASQASEEDKAKVAVAALTEGWRNRANDIHSQQVLAEMRKMSLGMIRRYGTDDSAVYAQIDRSYTDRNADMDEKLAALQALNSLPTEQSVQLLASYLTNIHQRRLTNTLTANDEQLVRVIIPALGNIGSVARSACRAILLLVQGNDQWGSNVRSLATAAINRIGI